MGTYYIPRNLKGESRILYVFTMRSLLATFAGGTVGLIFYFIIAVLLGQQLIGAIILGIFALIGFLVETVKIPTISSLKFTKNVGGEPLDEIIVRYVKFRSKKKVYTFAKDKEDK